MHIEAATKASAKGATTTLLRSLELHQNQVEGEHQAGDQPVADQPPDQVSGSLMSREWDRVQGGCIEIYPGPATLFARFADSPLAR